MNQTAQYFAVGLVSLTTFATITYVSPFTAVAVFAMILALGIAYVLGFAITDSYNMWVSNGKNESGKKASSSKDDR